MTASNLHLAWSRLFLRGLVAAGVEHLVLSPGSRSAPLALAAGAEPGLSVRALVDERAAAFFALGQVRLSGRPSALVCTSGTAPAHWYPAVIEASQQHLPLVLIGADRPWEAQGVAAPQTIDQTRLFGPFVRLALELGLPDPSPAALRAVPRIAAQAVQRALAPIPGPVHVNARFRKPLEPVDVVGPEPWESAVHTLLASGITAARRCEEAPASEAVNTMARSLARARRGFIVCGPAQLPCDPTNASDAAAALSRATGFPVLAEATSGVRFGGPWSPAAGDGVPVIGAIEPLLRSRLFIEAHLPEVIVELGGPPTSAAYAELLARHPELPRHVLTAHEWSDPGGGATTMLFGDPPATARALAKRCAELPGEQDRPWIQGWLEAEKTAWRHVDAELLEPELTEATTARLLVESLPRDSVLVVGNSGPIRDLDLYCPPASSGLTVLHQRGANGIDGLVAGAAGAASVAGKPVALLLGDISLLHDVGGLAVARGLDGPLVIVVVQNDGGRIFEALPLGRRPELAAVVERHFVIPQGADLSHAAALYGHAFARVDGPGELATALASALDRRGCTLIEARVPPRDGNARKARLIAAVDRELGAAPSITWTGSEPPGPKGDATQDGRHSNEARIQDRHAAGSRDGQASGVPR